MKKIHGITQESLVGAPTFFEVRAHLIEIMKDYENETAEKVILVGHSVVGDIEAMILEEVNYIDTTNFRFKAG